MMVKIKIRARTGKYLNRYLFFNRMELNKSRMWDTRNNMFSPLVIMCQRVWRKYNVGWIEYGASNWNNNFNSTEILRLGIHHEGHKCNK